MNNKRRLSVGVGILAFNEEIDLPTTLASLFKQSIFSNAVIDDENEVSLIEVSVVPNGCTDGTAKVARVELNRQLEKQKALTSPKPVAEVKVAELEQSGKSNAWNSYIHEVSRKDLDLIVMIDADIVFNQLATIRSSVSTLIGNDEADVVVDTPLKSISNKAKKSLIDRISIRLSKEHLENRIGVAGSFYCSYSRVLRKIWMPAGLPGEDGFLKAMIVTDMFRSNVNPGKIARAQNASHFYVPETSFSGIFRHRLRQIIGTSINCYLTWDFLFFATDPKGPGAGELLRNLIENESDWLSRFLENSIANRGFWVLPRGTITESLQNVKGKKITSDYKSYIAAFIRIAVNLPLFFIANQRIKSGKAIGFW